MWKSTLASLVTVTAVAVIVLSSTIPSAHAVSDAMLKIACKDMTPRHPGYKAENVQGVQCPFRLLIDTSPVVPGNLVSITLSSVNGSTPFKGFMIQARDAEDQVLGTYLPDCVDNGNKSHHMITCPNGVQQYNTVVQSNSNFKVKETFTWIAPISLKGPIRFKFTVVNDFEHFWTNEETNDIPVAKLSAEEYIIKSSINHEYYNYKLYIQNCFK